MVGSDGDGTHAQLPTLFRTDMYRIFIINGAMTVFLAVCGYLLIVDFPDKVSKSRWPFLTPTEVQAITNKLERDRHDAEFDDLTNKKFLDACKRWDLWVYALMFFAVTTIVYGLAFFIPIILQGSLGYSTKKTFLMSAPPAVCAVPWVLFTSWAADKYKMRGPVLVINAITGIIGLMIVAYAENGEARYFGIYVGMYRYYL
jgi:sugar phosphate permease